MVYIPSSFSEEKITFEGDRVLKTQISGSQEYFSSMLLQGLVQGKALDQYVIEVARATGCVMDIEHETQQFALPYYQGKNVEDILDNRNICKEAILQKLSKLFHLILSEGYLVLDFAPRNILLDTEENKLTILDFERGLCDISFLNKDELKFVFSFSIFEELRAFLSAEEINTYFLDMDTISIENIDISNISTVYNISHSKRREQTYQYISTYYPQISENRVYLLWIINNALAGIISSEQGIGKETIDSLEELTDNEMLQKIVSEVLEVFIFEGKISPKECLRRDEDVFIDDYLGVSYHSNNGKGFPRSGLHIYDYLIRQKSGINVGKCNTILDIGTGEIGFLGNSLARIFPESKVIGVEIDEAAYESATNNRYSDNLDIHLGSVFPEYVESIDLVVSNPPQMPGILSELSHDSGGKDGLDVFAKILDGISTRKGLGSTTLIVNLFDFLGIEDDFGRNRSVQSLVNQFEGEIVHSETVARRVRESGETFKNKDYICKLAPQFKFGEDADGLYHNMYIVTIKF